MRLLLLLLFVPAAARADGVADRVDREYVRPALNAVQDAAQGKPSAWTPPDLPVSARARALDEAVRSLWLEPLLEAEQDYAFRAARTLASPRDFSVPAAPVLPAVFSEGGSLPSLERLVSGLESRFSLGARAQPFVPAAGFARPSDFAYGASRRVRDSTKLVRGSRAASRPHLKPFSGDAFDTR